MCDIVLGGYIEITYHRGKGQIKNIQNLFIYTWCDLVLVGYIDFYISAD
jgi:hypothetical protein